jgi:SAM-dependent methyltransferase
MLHLPPTIRRLLSRVRRLVEGPVEIRASWERRPARYRDLVEFLAWFDATSSVEQCIAKAERDWRQWFAGAPHFSGLRKRRCLEIGFGGGRLLAQAARDFDEALGVDVHHAFHMTRRLLALQGRDNCTLLHRDDLPGVPDASIDFVYSFIVFQHFDSLEEVRHYLRHIRRVLAPEGRAHLYFGVHHDGGVKVASPSEFRPGNISLQLDPALMRREVERDFEVIALTERLPKNPATGEGVSDQASIVFKPR